MEGIVSGKSLVEGVDQNTFFLLSKGSMAVIRQIRQFFSIWRHVQRIRSIWYQPESILYIQLIVYQKLYWKAGLSLPNVHFQYQRKIYLK